MPDFYVHLQSVFLRLLTALATVICSTHGLLTSLAQGRLQSFHYFLVDIVLPFLVSALRSPVLWFYDLVLQIFVVILLIVASLLGLLVVILLLAVLILLLLVVILKYLMNAAKTLALAIEASCTYSASSAGAPSITPSSSLAMVAGRGAPTLALRSITYSTASEGRSLSIREDVLRRSKLIPDGNESVDHC